MPKKVKGISDVNPEKNTTIRVNWKTKLRLKARGTMLETEDDLINRILDELESMGKKK